MTRTERTERRAALGNMPDVLTAAQLKSRTQIEDYKDHRHQLLLGLTTPARVNTDAACRRGIASLAYTSEVLGDRTEIVRCENSTRAELMALLMAMEDADKSSLPGPVEYQLDCTAVANYRTMRTASLRHFRDTVDKLLRAHASWRLLTITRRENHAANLLAGKALHSWWLGK